MTRTLFFLAAESFEQPAAVVDSSAETVVSDAPVTTPQEVPLEDYAEAELQVDEAGQDIKDGTILADAMDSIGETVQGTLSDGGEGLTPQEAETVGTALEALRLVAGYSPDQVMNVSLESFGATTRIAATRALALEAEESASGVRASVANAFQKFKGALGKVLEKFKITKDKGDQQENALKGFWGKRKSADPATTPALPATFVDAKLAELLNVKGKLLSNAELPSALKRVFGDFARWLDSEVAKQEKALAAVVAAGGDKDAVAKIAIDLSATYANKKSDHAIDFGNAVFQAHLDDEAQKYHEGLSYVAATFIGFQPGNIQNEFAMPTQEETTALFAARKHVLMNVLNPAVDRFNQYQQKFGQVLNGKLSKDEAYDVRNVLYTNLYTVNYLQVNAVRHMLAIAEFVAILAVMPMMKHKE